MKQGARSPARRLSRFVSVSLGALALTSTPLLFAQAPAAGVPATWPIATGLTLHIEPPAGSTPLTDEALPVVDLSAVSGAKIVLRKGVGRVNLSAPSSSQHAYDTVVAVCATAPGEHFSPELEPLVFSRLNEVVRTEIAKGATVDQFTQGDAAEHELKMEQTFSATGQITGLPQTDGPPLKKRADGRHTLGFVDGGSTVLVCTIICSEYTADAARVCPAVVASARIDGTFSSPPSSSLIARLAVASTKKPLGALGVLVGIGLILGGLGVAIFAGRSARARAAS